MYKSVNQREEIADRIRGELRWSRADLARATGIRKATINELFNEVAEGVKFKHLELIYLALECEISDLLLIQPDEQSVIKNRTGFKRNSRS